MRFSPWTRWALLLLAVATAAPPAWGQTVESLEWMVLDSDVVVVGRVVGISEEVPAALDWWRLSFEVEEWIKRDSRIKGAPTLVEFSAKGFGQGTAPPADKGSRILVCLHRVSAGTPSEGFWPRLGAHRIAMDTRAEAIDRRGRTLTSPHEILAAARAAVDIRAPRVGVWLDESSFAKAPDGPSKRTRSIEEEMGRRGYLERHLVVPADDVWREHVRLAVAAGRLFPTAPLGKGDSALATAQNVELMKWVTASDHWRLMRGAGREVSWPKRLDEFDARWFYQRQEAWLVLQAWRVTVNPPTLLMPWRPHAPVRGWVWLVGVVVVLLAAGVWGWRRRRGGGFRGAAMTISLVLLIAVCAAWWRSSRRYDDLLWARGGVEHELSSSGGWVRYLRVEDGADARGIQFAGTPIDTDGKSPGAPGHWSALNAQTTAGAGGWTLERGMTASARSTRGHPGFKYLKLQAPYSGIALVLWVWPAAWGMGRVIGVLRRRRRRKTGRCRECGYDLRGVEGVCPECGWEFRRGRTWAAMRAE